MLYNSVAFALFFPVVTVIYFIIEMRPAAHRAANIWLLFSSYFFYMYADLRYGLLLLAVTGITYVAGIFSGGSRFSPHIRRAGLIAGTCADLSLLFFFKYFNFACSIFGADPAMKIVLPVGISFYVFQSLTYIFDLYKGDTEIEHDFFKYALFVSFFPVLLAGPIERSKNLLHQFNEPHHFDYLHVRHGLLRMLYGYFLKIVIAQRLAIVVDGIYDNYSSVSAFKLAIGIIFFSFQLYCDFASYSSIAVGCGEIMGFSITENFRQPFFSVSCADLWRRWHISLNSWFRNYLYIPLGGSRVPVWRKYLNVMIVFVTSGLWHGADWTFMAWGAVCGFFQVTGSILKPLREHIIALLPIHNKITHRLHHLLQILVTFFLFSFSFIFFRADDMHSALFIIKTVFSKMNFSDIMSTSPFSLGLGTKNFLFLCVSMCIMFLWDLAAETTGDAAAFVTARKTPLRWCVYYIFTIMIIASASLGSQQFIYFRF